MILTALLIAAAALRGGLVLVDAVVDDLQDLDGAQRSAETAKGRELVGVDLWHTPMMPVVRLADESPPWIARSVVWGRPESQRHPGKATQLRKAGR